MTGLDWIFTGLLLASICIGAWRGLVFEVLSVAGWVTAFFVAHWFAADMAAALPMGEASDTLRYAAGFVLLFVATVFGCGLIAWFSKKLIEAVGLRPADRMLGAAFGLVRGLVLLLVAACVAGLTPLGDAPWWQESSAKPWLGDALRGLKPVLPEEFARHLPA
jgi:membrane protein required for colicin V production